MFDVGSELFTLLWSILCVQMNEFQLKISSFCRYLKVRLDISLFDIFLQFFKTV